MEIGAKNDIALRVRSASKPDDKGTLICREANTDFVGVAADSQQEIFSCRKADSALPLEHVRSLAKLSLISHFHNTNDAVNKVFSNLLHHKVCPRYWSIDNGTRISVWIDASELTKAASALHCEIVHERLQVPA
ncbi:MAG: hypothetical protein C0507_17415 [Cyanobacteria bacterium PR.3.49]|nr:hypothetical protein [Cyanobacteria bacterium PR.3.49]